MALGPNWLNDKQIHYNFTAILMVGMNEIHTQTSWLLVSIDLLKLVAKGVFSLIIDFFNSKVFSIFSNKYYIGVG